MKIITDNLFVLCPLYMRIGSYPKPLLAFIELDCREGGTLLATWQGDSSDWKQAYFQKLVVRWPVFPEIYSLPDSCTASGSISTPMPTLLRGLRS